MPLGVSRICINIKSYFKYDDILTNNENLESTVFKIKNYLLFQNEFFQ